MLSWLLEYFVLQWQSFLREMVFGAGLAAFILVGVWIYWLHDKAHRRGE